MKLVIVFYSFKMQHGITSCGNFAQQKQKL